MFDDSDMEGAATIVEIEKFAADSVFGILGGQVERKRDAQPEVALDSARRLSDRGPAAIGGTGHLKELPKTLVEIMGDAALGTARRHLPRTASPESFTDVDVFDSVGALQDYTKVAERIVKAMTSALAKDLLACARSFVIQQGAAWTEVSSLAG